MLIAQALVNIDPGINAEELFEYVPDRPGHDVRYAIDSSKSLKELEWEPQEILIKIFHGMKKT